MAVSEKVGAVSVGVWTFSVQKHGENIVAFARFTPNPLCSVWAVCATQAAAERQIEQWILQIS